MDIYLLSLIISIVFLFTVLELVRKKRLQEKYSLLWILMSLLLLILAIVPGLIDKLAHRLDIINPPSLLFMLGLIYLLIYNLHLTTVISNQTEKITRLAQEIALIKEGDNK